MDLIPPWIEPLRADIERESFSVPWWLRGPHAQTFWSPIFRPRPELAWELGRLETPDGDHLRLHELNGEVGKPTVLLLHGLEGSVNSNYMGGQADRFCRRGWSVVAMEFRTCGGEMNQAPRMYHSGETTDLDFVAQRLAEDIRRGDRSGPLLISGVSLSGNVLAKWLGEAPDRVPREVAGCAAVSLPFDLEISGPTIDKSLFGFYRWRFLRTLRKKGLEKSAQYPEILDSELIRNCRTFEEFDSHGTAALHGFEDAWDYWRRSGCGQFLHRVNTPLLVIAAEDDPFNPGKAIPKDRIKQNPWLVGAFPEKGGHVGFVRGLPWRTKHFSEEQVERFLVGCFEALGP